MGYPMKLYVGCPVNGQPTVCVGAAYSYYEFKRPVGERMTDGEWRKMIDQRKQPSLPDWMKRYAPDRN